MKISVLINNYNNGSWLRQCIESVLAQTRPVDELVVYDDGSTDDSLKILRSYGDRIRLIEGTHDDTRWGIASQGHAVERALAFSRGDHIYLLDGDDAFCPDKIEAYENAWRACPDAVMVQAVMALIDTEGAFLKTNFEMKKHPADFYEATYKGGDTDLYYWTSALAFRRSFIEQLLPADFSDGIKAALDCRLAALAPLFGPVISLREPLTYWRQHAGSLSRLHGGTPWQGLWTRYAYFNKYAKKAGVRQLRFWRNKTFYKEVGKRFGPSWMRVLWARHYAKR